MAVDVQSALDALHERQHEIETQTAVEAALREYQASEKRRIAALPPTETIVIQEVEVQRFVPVTTTVTETVNLILNDDTPLDDGTLWSALKADALMAGFKDTERFL